MQGITSKNHGKPYFLQPLPGVKKKMRKVAVIFVKESGASDQYLQNAACTNFATEKQKAPRVEAAWKSNMPMAKN